MGICCFCCVCLYGCIVKYIILENERNKYKICWFELFFFEFFFLWYLLNLKNGFLGGVGGILGSWFDGFIVYFLV